MLVIHCLKSWIQAQLCCLVAYPACSTPIQSYLDPGFFLCSEHFGVDFSGPSSQLPALWRLARGELVQARRESQPKEIYKARRPWAIGFSCHQSCISRSCSWPSYWSCPLGCERRVLCGFLDFEWWADLTRAQPGFWIYSCQSNLVPFWIWLHPCPWSHPPMCRRVGHWCSCHSCHTVGLLPSQMASYGWCSSRCLGPNCPVHSSLCSPWFDSCCQFWTFWLLCCLPKGLCFADWGPWWMAQGWHPCIAWLRLSGRDQPVSSCWTWMWVASTTCGRTCFLFAKGQECVWACQLQTGGAVLDLVSTLEFNAIQALLYTAWETCQFPGLWFPHWQRL